MIDTNIFIGIGIIAINLIPFILKKQKYLPFTITLSLLIAAIKVLILK